MSPRGEARESAPCLGEGEGGAMLGAQRRVALDVLLACWGLGTWLGVNGLFVQLPLLVERLPEGWSLPSNMVLAVQLANVGLVAYAALRRALPRVPDAFYICALLGVGTLALVLNAFLYTRTANVGGAERSVPFLVLTFCVALVGCTSSVLFYPYMRHFRDVYLATFLVGEGLSGFIPSILALAQGVGGEPECVLSADNSTLVAVYPAARFDTTVFLLLLGGLSALSLGGFGCAHGLRAFDSEREARVAVAKAEEAEAPRDSSAVWAGVMALMLLLNALSNGVLPSVQSYSCMPYGVRAYHLAAALGAMANPTACLAGVWLRPAAPRLLAALLVAGSVPLAYLLATALLSPAPPLQASPAGEPLMVLSWVLAVACVSYARMWVYVWARRGGARGMRACGAVAQVGSALGSLLLFALVNYTRLFTQPPACPSLLVRVVLFGRVDDKADEGLHKQRLDVCPVDRKERSVAFRQTQFTGRRFSCRELTRLWRGCSAARLRVRAGAAPGAGGALREGVLLDADCPAAQLILAEASARRAFNPRYSWLVVGAALNASRLETMLAEVAVLPDADVVWAWPDAAADVYRVKQGQPLKLTHLAVSENSTQSQLEDLWRRTPATAMRRRDLDNVYLPAATIITHPQHFRSWSDVSSRAVDTFPKLTYPLLMLAAEDLHFRYNLLQVDLYGEERNGSFSGLAGMLQRGQLEIGVTSMFMRADRLPVLHYCSETVELRGAFLFRQPAQSAVTNVFVLPFSRGVWAAAAAAGAGAAAALAVLAALARRAACSRDPDVVLTPSDCCMFVIGAMCQQGSALSPRRWSLRLVMFCALLSSLFVFTSYSAKVVSILQAPSRALQTIDDLTDSPMGLGVQDTTYKKVYFAESKEAATQRLYRRKLAPLGDAAYLSEAEGVARIRTGLFAFQVEVAAGYDIISKTFTEREKCGLKEIQAFKLPMVAVPIRRHSGYRDLLASRLRWQREVGLVSRERRKWMAAAPRCASGAAGFSSVRLRDVLPAAHALLAGAAAALALLLTEHAAARIARAARAARAVRTAID
ncbi:uncharacterized protein [Battus philenor]|uniref:uncharacterized protein n=1 Tax=Battus philenor TaxID=42288 RepID=UPI0035CE99A9